MELAGRSLESKSRESITRAKPRRDRSSKGGAREKEGGKGGNEGRKEGKRGPASSKKIFEYDYIPRVNRIVRKRAACYTRNAFAGCRRWGERGPLPTGAGGLQGARRKGIRLAMGIRRTREDLRTIFFREL